MNTTAAAQDTAPTAGDDYDRLFVAHVKMDTVETSFDAARLALYAKLCAVAAARRARTRPSFLEHLYAVAAHDLATVVADDALAVIRANA